MSEARPRTASAPFPENTWRECPLCPAVSSGKGGPEARPTRLARGQTQHLVIQQRLLAFPPLYQQGINLNPSLQMGRLRLQGSYLRHAGEQETQDPAFPDCTCAHMPSHLPPLPFHHLSHNSFSSSSLHKAVPAALPWPPWQKQGPRPTTLRVEGWDPRNVQDCWGRGREQG